MSIKKRLTAISLMVLMSTSSMPVYAENQIPAATLQPKTSSSTIKSALPFKTIDGQEIQIPDIANIQNLNDIGNQVNSVSEANFAETKKVADLKAAILTAYGSTSVQYALIDNGKIVLSGNAGVYSKETKKAVTADNMYGIGSISKMFATTAVMKLVDQGKINLDAPVTQYIKEFKMADPRYKNITVRMLLNHSSGLMGSSFSNSLLLGDNDTYSHDTFLKQLQKQRLKAAPGAYSVYCNDGFTLAEILVERVAGVSFTNYITNNISNNLKMNNTKTPVSDFDREKLAKTYYSGISTALPVENLNSIGAGGIYSSAEDLCKFATTFTKNSNNILSKNSLKAMENKEYLRGIWPDDKDNIINYGLGWDSVSLYPFNQYNIKALSKGGDTIFYHSNLTVLPEHNMAIAVVSSGGSSMLDEIMAQEVLLAALKEKGVIKSIKPDKTFTPSQKVAVPSEIEKYEGLYASSTGFLDIKIDKSGSLSLSLPEMPQYAMTYDYTKNGTFVSKDGSESLKFVKESNGKVYLQQTAYLTLPSLGQIVMDSYAAQKETVSKLPENISKNWTNRTGKNYYLLNEKYSSIFYMLSRPSAQVGFSKGFEGYLGINKIINKSSAIPILDGPGTMSRDQQDYCFFTKDKFEYLYANGSIYIEEASLNTLSTDNKFTYTINKDGFAKWFKIGDKSAGKEITVDIPQNSAFAVYDSNGALVNNSLITGIKKVTLPKNGTIVFIGKSQAKFNVQYN
ncbi:MAG: serine hydrolase domain-containing protein [Clostridiaceae bacterium]